jgi:hypothetical protein
MQGNTGTGNSGKAVPVGREPEAGKSDPSAKHQESIGEHQSMEESEEDGTGIEDDEPVLTENDLEENDLSIEEADNMEWDDKED